MKTNKKLKTDTIQWDLSCFYAGVDDPQIEKDTELCVQKIQQFDKKFRGKLSADLGNALKAYGEINMLKDKIFIYLFLLKSLNQNDEAVKTKLDVCEKKLQFEESEHLVFFTHELTRISEHAIQKLVKKNKIVAFNLPWIKDKRRMKPHLLSEEVETALMKRSLFGPDSWSRFYDEVDSNLAFLWEDKSLTQNELLLIVNDDPDKSRRARALAVFNETLGKQFAALSAQALNMIVGLKQVEDGDRGFKTPMEARNKENKIPDIAVNALHEATITIGGPLVRRYYSLKGQHLGIQPLAWSDRNAPIPFKNTEHIPYPEAIALVLEAYESFSPTLAQIIRDMIREKRIDAHAKPGRSSGAFNFPAVLPGDIPACFTFLSYMGTERDVMTLAHELGHAVHGILAGKAQGVLMQSASTALAETASIFGEMTTFNFLKERQKSRGNKKMLIALNMNKLSDSANSIIRQISFSNFERRVHATKNRLSVSELNAIWMEVTQELYGKDGDVFTHEHCEYLWSYIPHFHDPFYVYGYAFGELLTQSLYATQEGFKKKEFEKLYLDLLRAGRSKSPKELLEPFGLDPTNPDFWKLGFQPIDTLLTETEILSSSI
ncbi:MAG TPA: M3 family oligoendopeptidase [Candidatus Paceibacterota bacterium]